MGAQKTPRNLAIPRRMKRVGLFEILPAMIPGTRHATNARKVRPAHRIVKLFFPENSRNRNTFRERRFRLEHIRQIQAHASPSGRIEPISAVSDASNRPGLMHGKCAPNLSKDRTATDYMKSTPNTFKQQEITDHCLNPVVGNRIIRPQFRPGRDRPFAESSSCRLAEANRS